MGVKLRQPTGKYLKLKDGKLYFTKDETNTPYDELEGQLVDIYLKDEEYKGDTQRKLYIVMNDSVENLILGFRLDSRYGTSFLNFVKSIDITKPFTIVPISKEEKDANGETVVRSSILISQDGKFAKSYFSKNNPNGLPEMKKVKLNGKQVWDKTEMLEFYEGIIENDLKPQLKPVVSTTTISKEQTPEINDEDSDDEESYPWDK